MAPSLKSMVAAGLLLIAAPLIEASAADARSCVLCIETAINQAHNPICAQIFNPTELNECLCAAGNTATCDAKCAGTGQAASDVCKALITRADNEKCEKCWNKQGNKMCPGKTSFELQKCLCNNKHEDKFIAACKNSCRKSTVTPAAYCQVSKVSARQDDASCAACWNGMIAERCPWTASSFDQNQCLCSAANRDEFIGKCDPACANSIFQPSDACISQPLKRQDDASCAACWKAEGDRLCPGLTSFAEAFCLCAPGHRDEFIAACDPACANSVSQPSDVCKAPFKRDAQNPWATNAPCGTVPGQACDKTE